MSHSHSQVSESARMSHNKNQYHFECLTHIQKELKELETTGNCSAALPQDTTSVVQLVLFSILAWYTSHTGVYEHLWLRKELRDTVAAGKGMEGIYLCFLFKTEPQHTHPETSTRPSWPRRRRDVFGTQSSSCHLPVECSICAAVHVGGFVICQDQLRLACWEL